MTPAERLLTELIALPSVNPAFLPAGHPRAGEGRVAEYLATVAARAGLEVELPEVLPGRPNLVARLLPAGPVRCRVLLVPHLDTVDADPAEFTPRTGQSRIWGRGACDTKGSAAAMLTALMDMAAAKQRPRQTEIVFAAVIDEENAQAGSRALVRAGWKADLAVVGEPTRGKVVTAHKGSVWLRLRTRGRAAHGSRPELGRNAIHAMARVVDALETDYVDRLRRRRHALLGCATANVGTIRGGTQPNIVPDACVICVDRRTLPGETEAGVRREIRALLAGRRLKASFASEKLAPCLPLETDPGLPLVRQFLRSAGQPRPAGVDFFCDAAVLAAGGIPSVVFGPGDIAQAHTAAEWISTSALERGKQLLVRFLSSLP
jgi:succinyl-diaminopimelate desuccinylase